MGPVLSMGSILGLSKGEVVYVLIYAHTCSYDKTNTYEGFYICFYILLCCFKKAAQWEGQRPSPKCY